MVAGFTYSQILLACVRSGLLQLLRGESLTTEEVAVRTALPLAGAERLLKGAAALGLTELLSAERWTIGSQGAALLGQPGLVEMIAHHDRLYADLADPLALLRREGGGGSLSAFWRYAEASGAGAAGEVAGYSGLMTASLPLVAQQVVGAYPFARYRRMLDIGGGEGAFVAAVAARAPDLMLSLFDLPLVSERAREYLARHGLAERVDVVGGDFLSGTLPVGHDLVTLVRVLHDHDDRAVAALLRAGHDALEPGGTLLIAEPMAGTRGARRSGDAYFGMYLLAMGSGHPRTAAEIKAMLMASGFARPREIGTPLPLTVRMIAAEKPYRQVDT